VRKTEKLKACEERVTRGCPFCGDERVDLIKETFVEKMKSFFHARCSGCLARGPVARTADEAAGFWNLREAENRALLEQAAAPYKTKCGFKKAGA